MNKNKNVIIGVIAGTPVDTQMGLDLVNEMGYKAKGFPTASCPKEQNQLQFLQPKQLTKKVVNIIKKLEQEEIFRVMIYCNSLSSAIDLNYVRNCCQNALITTPLDIYEEISCNFKKIILWTANGQSLASIENIFYKNNPKIEIIGVSMLPVINAIERQEMPKDIFEQFRLENLCLHEIRAEALILGCTHLPYLLTEILKNINIPVIDPAEKMLKKLIMLDHQ